MNAVGEGTAANSSAEMSAWMGLEETDGGVVAEWVAEAAAFGRIAQLGGRVINPVANRIVNEFFDTVADRLKDATDAHGQAERSGLRGRVRNLL